MEVLDEMEYEMAGEGRKLFRPTANGARDNAETPNFILKYVLEHWPQVSDDPCPLEPEQDGLKIDWGEWSFVHPPHSECQQWVEKAVDEAQKNHYSVMLVPAAFNSLYWRESILPFASEVRILTCPLRFQNHKRQVATPMVLVVFAAPGRRAGQLPIVAAEPENWQQAYYKRQRNRDRFGTD